MNVNLYDKLKVEKFEANEFMTLLSEHFSVQMYPNDNSNTIVVGNNELVIKFKKGKRQILSINRGENLSRDTIDVLSNKINEVLSAEETVRISAYPIFVMEGWDFSPVRWRNEWQVGPPPPGSAVPQHKPAYYPAMLQYRYSSTGLGWLDFYRAQQSRRRAFLSLVPLGPLLMEKRLVDLRPPFTTWVWVHTGSTCEIRMQGYRFGVSPDESEFFNYPTPTLRWGNGEPQCHAEVLLLKLDRLSPADQEQYLTGCHWYHRALIEQSSTVAFLCLITMIETLLDKVDPEKCNHCGQLQYSVSERFTDFMNRYAGPTDDSQESRDQFKKFTKNLYTLRSAIAHTGSLLGAEYNPASIGFTPVEQDQELLLRELRNYGSLILCNWLFSK